MSGRARSHTRTAWETGAYRGWRRAGHECRHRYPPCRYNMEPEYHQYLPDLDHAARQGGEPSWGASPFRNTDRTGRFVVLASGTTATVKPCRSALTPAYPGRPWRLAEYRGV